MDFIVVVWQQIVQMELNGQVNFVKLLKTIVQTERIGVIMLVFLFHLYVQKVLYGI